jgi:hypothetical protein
MIIGVELRSVWSSSHVIAANSGYDSAADTKHRVIGDFDGTVSDAGAYDFE